MEAKFVIVNHCFIQPAIIMSPLNPYLGFNGNCREAMNFYQSCFGGELEIQTIAEAPVEVRCEAGQEDHVLHAFLRKGDMLLMGSDMAGPGGYKRGSAIALSYLCSSEEDIKTKYEQLSEGGKVIDPLQQQFWGDLFAVVEDKFGITWMFNYDKEQEN